MYLNLYRAILFFLFFFILFVLYTPAIILKEAALFLKTAYAADEPKTGIVLINEIAWMGTLSSSNNEWIELYSNAKSAINLDDWILKAADGSPEIKLTGLFPANSYYLLERTNDDTVPGVKADKIYTGALNNSGEKLELYDSAGNLMDSVDCSSSWLGGDNIKKLTMERTGSGWQNSLNPEGTPKLQNSISAPANDNQPVPKTTSTALREEINEIKPEPGPPIEYPSGVIINEILPSPAGADAEEEWIEIFNQNSFKVNLMNWKIGDIVGSVKNYIFPEGTIIAPNEYLIIPRPLSKITLNNSNDGLKLVRPDGKTTDEINYKEAPQNKSYNLSGNNWFRSDILTPGKPNIIPGQLEKEKNPIEEIEEEKEEEKELAAIGRQLPEKTSSLFPFFAALTLSVLSGILILSLKNKIKVS